MTDFKTGVARIVWGHPLKGRPKKDNAGNPVIRDGQPVTVWAYGVAIPKHEFEATCWPFFDAEAKTIFPNGVPQGFSWKYIDGDGVDKHGQPYATREGYAGCYVLAISTEIAPSVYKFNAATNQYDQVSEHEIKCGDYTVQALSLKANMPTNSQHTPGIYVNPQAIELVGYGTEINNGPDPMSLLGGQTYQLPAGASMTPVAPQTSVGMPGMQPAPAQPGMQPAPAQPGMQPAPAQPGMQPAPTQPGMQPAPTQPGMQPAPTQPGMQPAPAQPGMQPAPAQPGMQPAPTQPGMQPAPAQPGMQPAPTQPGMQPAPAQPGMQPAPAQPGMQPAPTQPGMQPAPAHDFVQNAGMQPGMVPNQ